MSEQPHASGASVLVLDGGRWRIVPQVNLVGVRPDFVCMPAETRLPPIAVFTDGYEFHASLGINRLADDARKREALRAGGHRVLSIAMSDLDGPWDPQWLDDGALTMLKSGAVGAARAAAVTDEAVQAWRGGPLSLLEALLLEEAAGGRGGAAGGLGGVGAEARAALADAAWGPLLIGSTQHVVGLVQGTPTTNIDPLREAVDVLAPDAGLPGTSEVPGERATSLSVFTWPHLTLAVRLHGQSTTAMALVLDDRDEAVREPAFRESWQTWLRLSNVLQFAEAPLRVTTVTEALTELRMPAVAGVAGMAGALAVGGVDGSGAARAAEALGASGVASAPAESVARETATLLAELGWDTLDPTITDPRVLALVPLLAERGVAHTDDGQELAGGIMADLSWPTERVVLLVPEAAADAPELEAAGWRVVVLDDGAGGAGDSEAAQRAVDELAGALAATGR